VDIHATTQFQVVVMHAQKFDDVIDIADHLKAKKPVVVNMEQTDPEMIRRMIDFISGVVYAIDGGIQKISKVILLVTPYNVEITGDLQDELRSKGLFPWE
jgi:cell division inhibitor SepF